MLNRIEACSSFEEHAQDGRGIKRPAARAGEFLSSLAARSRALCASTEHAQDGRCIKAPVALLSNHLPNSLESEEPETSGRSAAW